MCSNTQQPRHTPYFAPKAPFRFSFPPPSAISLTLHLALPFFSLPLILFSLMSSSVTPDDVLELTKPTNGNLFFQLFHFSFFFFISISLLGFLCALTDNQYDLEFINFTISDYDTKNIIFEVGKDLPPPQDMTLDFSSLGEDMYRRIKYTFSEDVLRLPFIQTSSADLLLPLTLC
jgi:hypothetical protein